MKKENTNRPPLESLACVNLDCDLYGQKGHDNLIVRKVYGKDKIRYLRCRLCQEEFSERKNTAFWNSKIRELDAVSIAEHLSERCGIKQTARLVKVDPSTVRRMNKKAGKHGQQFHDQEAQGLEVTELQADERHGFAIKKGHPAWEAELYDPKSKFVLEHVQGARDEQLIRNLLEKGAERLKNRHDIALFTDGLHEYKSIFPEIFGKPYQPVRKGTNGRYPKEKYRIPRSAAHVQIVKNKTGGKLDSIEIRYSHGSQKRIEIGLKRLGYNVPNTSAIERRNGTARLMSAAQVRKTLTFAKRADAKEAMGWWCTTVYNWCRVNRSLRQRLPKPIGKKSLNKGHPLWQLA